MASMMSRMLDFIIRTLRVKNAYETMFSTRRFGRGDMKGPPKSFYSSLSIETVNTDRGKVYYITKPDAAGSSGRHILYLHGGGYIHGINRLHWIFLKTLVNDLDCTIVAPEYPLAPEFTFHDSFEMVIPIYKTLIGRVGGENLILMGDSSGGGFALALAQKAREENMGMASQIILISPWLDITLKNKGIIALDDKDPILGVNGLRRAGLAYAGNANPSHYLLSPINGEMDGLGKITVFIGTKDLLLADTRKLKAIMQEKGIEMNYYEYPDMLHVWPLFNLPESKDAIEQIELHVNEGGNETKQDETKQQETIERSAEETKEKIDIKEA